MKRISYMILSFLISIPLSAQIVNPDLFEEHVLLPQFSGACSIMGYDMDKDSDIDFVASASTGGSISWFENDGSQNFTEHPIKNGLADARVFDIGDIDGDNDADIVTTAYGALKFSWLENDGAQNFTEHIIVNTWGGASYVEIHDIDKDGDLDICAAACGGNILGWFENDGNENFTVHTLKENWEKANFISAVDIDQDGDNDLICSSKTGEIIIFENDGSSNFTERIICNNWGAPNAMRAADFDGDGDLDFAATSCTGANQVAWFRNNGNLTFERIQLRQNYEGARDTRVADIDDDGDDDIITIAWITSVASVFINDGNGNFTENIFCETAYDMLRFSILDIDKDGDLDIFGACFGQNQLRWWENKLKYLKADFTSENTTGHCPLTVNFNDASVGNTQITSRKWDFNNDGIFDSELENPTYTFQQPGEYTVTLELGCEWGTKKCVKEKLISVFSDGESSLRFNGNSGTARCTADESISLTNNFTFEAWFYIDDFSKSRKIFDKGKIKLSLVPNTFFNDYCVYMEITTNSGTISKIYSSNNSVEAMKWTHVACSYSSDNQLHIYINGIDQELRFVGSQPSGDVSDNNGLDLLIGNDDQNSSPFSGRIDEIRIWKTVRSQAEIAQSYLLYLAGNENDLVGYWKLNEGTGANSTDITTSANIIGLENITWGQGVIFGLVNNDDKTDLSPNTYRLLSNYPNPFNPSTTIIYDLEKESFVTVKIFDLLGRELSVLINETQKAGRHTVEFDAAGLAAGFYIYTLSTPNYIISNKMMLLK